MPLDHTAIPTDDARAETSPRPALTRRSILLGSAAAAGLVLVGGAAPAQALTYSVKTQAEHKKIAIAWGHPLAARATRGSGVDGYPGKTYAGHIGADYYAATRVGSIVYAVADGTVTSIGDDGDYGRGVFVVVQHALGIRSEYLHFQRGSTRVTRGQVVRRGTPLGKTGNTGDVRPRTTANAHLHLAIVSGPHRAGVVYNPAWLVETAPLPKPATK